MLRQLTLLQVCLIGAVLVWPALVSQNRLTASPPVANRSQTGESRTAAVSVVRASAATSADADTATVVGLTERTLVLPTNVPDDAAIWRGFLAFRDISAFESAFDDSQWQQRQKQREQQLRAALAAARGNDRAELQARLDVLTQARRTFQDPGLVTDLVLLKQSGLWRLLVDADRNGRLDDDPEWGPLSTDAPPLTFRGQLPGVAKEVMLSIRFHEPEPAPRPAGAGSVASPGPAAERAERIAYLHALDGINNRKLHLPRVIAAADAVIETFGDDVWTRTPAGLSPQQQQAREQLIDAVYRKGRALAYMELPDVVARNPIVDQDEHDRRFEENFRQLARLVDTTQRKYFLLHIRRDRRRGDYGQAIRLLNHYLAETPDVWLFHKKRRDLYGLLGWDDWQSYEHAWMLVRFPEQHLK